jgi:hypothetical protein
MFDACPCPSDYSFNPWPICHHPNHPWLYSSWTFGIIWTACRRPKPWMFFMYISNNHYAERLFNPLISQGDYK